MKTKHPFKSFRNIRPHVDADVAFEACKKHVADAPAECEKWVRREGKSGCYCLSSAIQKGKEPVTSMIASYMVRYYNFHYKKRMAVIMKLIGDAPPSAKGPQYCLDFMVDNTDTDNELRSLKVCRYSLGYLLDFRLARWKTLRKHVQKQTLPSYGKKAKNHQVIGELDLSDVDDFFLKFQTSRLLQGQVTSKRQLYNLFCRDRGWSVSLTKKGAVKTTVAVPNPKPILARSAFDVYWRRNFPHVVVGESKEVQSNNDDDIDDNNVCFGGDDDSNDSDDSDDDDYGYDYCIVRADPFWPAITCYWWPAITFCSPIGYKKSLSEEEKKILEENPKRFLNKNLAGYIEAHAAGKFRDVIKFLSMPLMFFSNAEHYEEYGRYGLSRVISDRERGLEILEEQKEVEFTDRPDLTQRYKEAVKLYKERRNPYS